MKRRIFSVALVLCLVISSQAVVQGLLSPQEEVFAEEPIVALADSDSIIPTPTEVYESMIALQSQDMYKEGVAWTDYEPYSDTKGYYKWNGGTLGGVNVVAVGCVAFAFTLSDAAFGSLPARMYAEGEFSYEDIKVGDILRVNNDTHTVIVLEVSDAGVVIAEGNNSGKVHWGRAISKNDVMSSTSHYITRYPEGYVAPDDPAANEIIGEGTFEGGFSWELTKAGTMTISGSGAMPDFSSTGEQPWNFYNNKIRKVVIEDGITSIGSCAFWTCGLLNAAIPSSVTTIGNSAFRESSIISVTIPSSVTTIGDSAFRECQNLSVVSVSEGVTKIEQNAFRGCTSLTSIALPASMEEVGAAAFFQCTKMISATFAAGSKQVKFGDNIFSDCYYLMSVTLPQSIDCIGEGMFQNCLLLAGVEIPQGATSIGGSAFASSGVSVVIIPDSVQSIGIAAFSACPLTDIYYTGTQTQWSSVSKIGDTASAVSKATIHYEYIPEPESTPGQETTTEPDATTETTTVPDATTEPESTTVPDSTTETETTTEQKPTTTEPETTTIPQPTTEPETTTVEGSVTEPETTTATAPTTAPAPTTSTAPTIATTPTTSTAPTMTTTPTTTPAPPTTSTTSTPTASAPTTAPTTAQASAPTETQTTVSAQTMTAASVAAVEQTTPPSSAATEEQTTASAPSTAVPFVDDGSGNEGWDAIKEQVENASEGNQVSVNMNGASVVPEEVIDSMKGQDITISFDMGNGITWLVNGKDVTDHANNVDLSVQVGTSAIPQSIVSDMVGDCQTTQLSLAYSGDFGYSAVLMINVGSTNAGMYANLFYYNESTSELEFVTADQIDEEGFIELTFTHASDYVIVVDNDVMGEEDSSEDASENNDVEDENASETPSESNSSSSTAKVQQEESSSNFIWVILVVVVVVIGVIIYVIQKKRK